MSVFCELCVVGTWYLWNKVRSLCAFKAWSRMFLCPGECQSFQDRGLPRAPQGAKSHRGVKIQLETPESTTIGHSGPHDLWGHLSYIMPAPHLLISLFHPTLRDEQKAVEPLLIPLSERSSGPAHSSNSNNFREESCSSSSSHQGNLLAIQALQTSEQRRDVLQENFKPTTGLQSPTEPRRPHYRQDDFTELQTAQQTLFPLFTDGNTTGLIMNILG